MALVAFEAEQAISKIKLLQQAQQEKMIGLLRREAWRKWDRESHGTLSSLPLSPAQTTRRQLVLLSIARQEEWGGEPQTLRERSLIESSKEEEGKGVGKLLGRGEMEEEEQGRRKRRLGFMTEI